MFLTKKRFKYVALFGILGILLQWIGMYEIYVLASNKGIFGAGVLIYSGLCLYLFILFLQEQETRQLKEVDDLLIR